MAFSSSPLSLYQLDTLFFIRTVWKDTETEILPKIITTYGE